MSKETNHADLLVFEYGGKARSGKGTIVEYLSETYPDVTRDETGFYYRLLTKKCLDTGRINSAMETARVQAALADFSEERLAALLADSNAWLDDSKRRELYQNGVNQLVPDVGQIHNARQAVKTGFANRIQNLIAEGDYQVVAIDGRNLSEVVKKINGARMLLRTFVECSPFEAALRECARSGKNLASAEGQEILASLEGRNQKDQIRQEDPMVVDDNAIDYWAGTDVEDAAKQLAGAQSAAEYLQIVEALGVKFSELSLPKGVGRTAVLSGRQVKFDTTVFRLFDQPKEAMLAAADQMFHEALEATH